MAELAQTGVAQRYWTARDAELRVDAGYLADPEGPYAAFLGLDQVVSLGALDNIPCLVLLGEPGSGKTTALRDEVAGREAEIAASAALAEEVVLRIDLRDFADIADLRDAVFGHPEIVRWRSGTHRLTLALDSLDEALIEMRKLATRLASELRALPIGRLSLRIACRTADWPPILERELETMWGKDMVRVLEIAPLRRVDVRRIAAERLGAERADEFVDAVAAQNAEPFAAKPGTLTFLISSFSQSGQLPASQVELYMIGCRMLCEEKNESRRAARRTGTLSTDQRVIVAARVAAVTVLGGRTAVWTGIDQDVLPGDVRRADLVGDEHTAAGNVRVDEHVLRDEILSSGLFSARGSERLGWAHQTYGEFLAAWWITRRGLTSEQILALLTMHDGVGQKLVPQLHETAAWVASMRPELFSAIMAVEPWVLMRSDVAKYDPESRRRLVASLLEASQQNTLPAPEFGQILGYRHLQFPELSEQLRPVISDPQRPDRVRELALDIALACKTQDLAADAADLALDTSAPIQLRAVAARLVTVADDKAQAARLRPLALESSDNDERDDLKGSALRATWRTFAPTDLFAALSRSKRPNLGGAYGGFLLEFAKSISDEYIAPGLRWIEQFGHATSIPEQRLQAAVIHRALWLLDDEVVRRRLVRRVRRCLATYEPLLDDSDELKGLLEILADQTVRRRLLVELVSTAANAANISMTNREGGEEVTSLDPMMTIRRELEPHALMNYGYLTDADFSFVLEMLAGVTESPESLATLQAWGEIARGMLDTRRVDHANAVLERAAAHGVHEAFKDLIEPVDLDSPEAEVARRSAREQEELSLKWATERARWEQRTVKSKVEAKPLPSADRLAAAAGTVGDAKSSNDLHRRRWVELYLELVRDEKGEIPMRGSTGDVRVGIAWEDAGVRVREEVVDAAKAFLESAEAPELDPGVEVHYHGYAWAGYVAFRLLAAAAPELVERLAPEIWERWAPIVALAEPSLDDPEEQKAHLALSQYARSAATTTFNATVLSAVDHALATDHGQLPVRVVTSFAVTPLGDAVLACCLQAGDREVRETAAVRKARLAPGLSDVVSENESKTVNEGPQRTSAGEPQAWKIVELLAALLRGGSGITRDVLARALQNPTSFASLDLASAEAAWAFIAARALLVGAEDAGWDVISKVVEAAPAFAAALFLQTASSREIPITNFRERLGVQGTGELYVALTRAFPYETDPWHNGVYSPSARDNVVSWRRAMLNALEEWNSREAINELQRIQAELPQYDWLAFSVARAREQQGRAAWRPVSPADLFALADSRDRRLVRDEDELLELVTESLMRYQRDLQGDLPSHVDLWDYSAIKKPRPRDEGHFADHVARFLKKDLEGRGIAVGCELVVRRGGKGRAPGLRTDIYVTGAIASTYAADHTDGEIASLVIEVKGSWHPEVLSAMRTQLVDSYLKEYAGTRRGIYLVGDFTSDKWENGVEYRRSKLLGGIMTLQKRLDTQAQELSRGGIRLRAVVLDASLPAT